jgi:hypothetical protein
MRDVTPKIRKTNRTSSMTMSYTLEDYLDMPDDPADEPATADDVEIEGAWDSSMI